jgi:hypothetical protein
VGLSSDIKKYIEYKGESSEKKAEIVWQEIVFIIRNTIPPK